MSADVSKMYTDADVDAAVAAIENLYVGSLDVDDRQQAAWDAVAVLEAVVPGIVARAKAEALREAADALKYPSTKGATYEMWSSGVGDYLRARADDLERGVS